MDVLKSVIQVIIALGILNVWLLRFNKPSEWRGKRSLNMREEFAAYGLPGWSVFVVGAMKITLATFLLVGLFVPEVTEPAAVGLALLMLGAVLMHIRVKDPSKRSLPALTLLILCVLLALL